MVLDRSGSMVGNETDVIGGFNTFIAEQKTEGLDKKVTLALFDDKYETQYEGLPIAEVPELTALTYFTRGMTRLLDAVGTMILGAGERYNMHASKPEGVLMLIYTDGLENNSQEFTSDKIRQLIEQQKNEWNWEFLFYGADMDAFAQAGAMGIDRASTVQTEKTPADYVRGFGAVSGMSVNYAATVRKHA